CSRMCSRNWSARCVASAADDRSWHDSAVRRFVIILSGLVVVVLIGVAVFAYASVRRSFPDISGSVTVSGLNGEVTITRDEFGIPQIYADNPQDLFFAQGYVHAQDRFFEMDF